MYGKGNKPDNERITLILRSFLETTVAVGSSIAYSECMFVALGIQHAMHMCHVVISSLSGSTIFFYIIS
jgi:hypothetical protein